MMNSKLISLSCNLVHETELAWLLDFGNDDDNDIWIPKSCGELHTSDDGNSYDLEIDEFYATRKGLI